MGILDVLKISPPTVAENTVKGPATDKLQEVVDIETGQIVTGGSIQPNTQIASGGNWRHYEVRAANKNLSFHKRMDRLNYGFTFEFLSGRKRRHITLFVNPEEFSQTEPTRTTVTQTKGGAFVDGFGMGLRTISIRGVTGFKDRDMGGGRRVSGHQHWLDLRDLIRDYTDKFKDDATNNKLRFYNWSDEEYWEVICNSFALLRNVQRPLLYQYNMQLTCLKPIAQKERKVTEEDAVSDYLLNPPKRAGLILNKIDASLSEVNGIINKTVDLSKFSPGTQLFGELIAKGAQYFDSVSGVYKKIEDTIGDVSQFSKDLKMYVNGVSNFITKPFELVQGLAVSITNVISTIISAKEVPHELAREFREMVCAIKALPESLFKGFTNPSLFEGASNCGTTLGIGEAPVSIYDNSFTATAQIPPLRNVSQVFVEPQLTIMLKEEPTDVKGVYVESDVSRIGLNYLDSFTGQKVNLTAVPNVPVVIDYSAPSPNTSQLIKLKAAEAVVVKVDDTLEQISLEAYDDASRWKEIALFNGIEYPFIVKSDFETEIRATGTIRFYRLPGFGSVITIPKGYEVYVPSYRGTRQVTFRTTETKIIDLGLTHVDVTVEAEFAGDAGNSGPNFVKGPYEDINWAPTWTGNSGFLMNKQVRPTVPNGRVYRALEGGITYFVEPTWPLTYNSTFKDGTVTWICERNDDFESRFYKISGVQRINNLNSMQGGRIWHVSKPGDVIFIPKTETEITNTIISSTPTYDELFGYDIKLHDGEIQADVGQYKDFLLVSGTKNLVQALSNRINTEREFYFYHPEYGTNLPYYIGQKNEARWQDLVKVDIRQACLLDPRIDSLEKFLMQVSGDTIDIEFNAIPINESTGLKVNLII